MKFDRPTLFLFGLTLFTLILWALEEVRDLSFNSIVGYIAPIAAITSVIFMSFDFISATRFRFLEKFAGGLDVLYRFHSYIGKLAGMIIIAHPLFLLLSRGLNLDNIKRFFLPGSIEFFNWGIVAFWLLMLLIVLTIFVKMNYKWWKYTHLFMGAVYLFGAYHVFLDYTNAQRSPGITFKEAWVLATLALGLLALIYKELIYPFIAHKLKVTKVNPIGLVTEVYMEPEKPIKFIPGQYVFMSVMDNPELPNEAHPFGITSGVNDKDIRVSIKALGDYTKKAGVIKPGNKVHLWGPYGMFTWDNFDKYKKQVWIAGGIGVAPFLGMLKYSNEIKSDKDITLYYVEKNAGECEYNAELSELTKNSNVKFYNHYDDDGGFLTAKYVAEQVGDLSEAAILICGPAIMMKILKGQFLELGLKLEQIKEEEFAMKR